jgi:hypothetical protein
MVSTSLYLLLYFYFTPYLKTVEFSLKQFLGFFELLSGLLFLFILPASISQLLFSGFEILIESGTSCSEVIKVGL